VTFDAVVTLVVVLTTVAVLVRDLVAPVAAVLGATIFLLVVGVIDAGQAFSGFSNPAPITVAALYVLARAVEATGALEPVINKVMGRPDADRLASSGAARRLHLFRVVAPAGLASAFLNNTPIVAMVAPQIAEWSSRRGLSSSPLLMPLSFAAILGGVVTVIGTSTNLVVSGLLEQAGEPPIGMFEITRIGLPLAVGGLLIMLAFAHRALPDRKPAFQGLDQRAREFSVSMEVLPDGALEGKSISDAGLRDLQGVYLSQVERSGSVIVPVAPTEVLQGDDILTFVGRVDMIVDLQRKRGLTSTEGHHAETLGAPTRHSYFEAVIGAESPLVGHTLKEVGFRSRYNAAVVGIHRAGVELHAKLGEVRLQVGDTLLVLADQGFRGRWRDTADFLLIAGLGGSPPAMTRKAPIVGVIGFLLVFVAGAGLVPILNAALVAALALVATGVLTPREARDAVDLNIVVLIAAAFGLGAAVQVSGLADILAGGLQAAFSPLGEWGVILGIVLATMALTELITNNAAAVLMFPLAMSTAGTLGASPRPFAMAIAVAASASFLTPIGYQTNTMVYGLGGYRFTDFARLGTPLSLLVIVATTTLIPVLWPL
jgi:di/tricarboxylate transporter